MPVTGNHFRDRDSFKITILGFATAAVANGMHIIILPVLVQSFVSEAQKSTYLGIITFAGLVIAIITQPLAGAFSDRCSLRWGRRKPFILVGILGSIGLLMGIGIVENYMSLFIIWFLVQASLNIAQGPFQAFIPDLVPEGRRGLASGVKSLLEIAGGVALIRVIGGFMGNYSPNGGDPWLMFSLGILALALLITLLLTIFTVRESPGAVAQNLPFIAIVTRVFRIDYKAHGNFMVFLVSRLMFIMALAILQTFSFYYLQDVVQMADPARVTAELITVVGVAMLVVVYPAGRLSDRVGRHLILLASGITGALGIAVIFFFREYSLILFGGGLIGIAGGAFMSTNWALATDLIPADENARFMGLTNLASAGGAAIARLIGPVIDFFNQHGEGLGYSIMLGTCFVFFILGAILILKIKVKRE